ncbi:MAG: right-handed parallel beta-helix repeat-containing protein, partial [Marinicella sp.]
WEKPAYNNHYDKDNKIPLDRLFQDFEFANYDLVDKSTFASMMAYIDVTGSGHHDETHNWMFYYDAYYEKMFPIIWDTVGWLQSRKSVDELNIASSEFLVHLYKNFEFHKLKIRSLLKFYQNDKQNFLTELDQAMQKSEALIRQNGYSFNLGRLYFTVEQALEQIDFFYQRVKYRIDLIENHFLGQVDPQHFKYQILSKNEFRLEVDGGKMIEGIGLITNQEITSDSAFVSYFQNGKELQVNITNFLEKRDDGIYINIDLMSNSVIKPGRYRFKTENSKATYDFKIHGLDTNQLNQINLSFANLTNQKLTLQSSNSIAISPFDDNFNHIISLPKTSKPIFLSGDVLIKSDTVYHQNVTIEPGTTFFIDNDVSLKFYGQVTAIGTAEQPITFKPLNDKEPWNAVVVKDAGANGSRFAYCDFLGGSGDKGDLYEYTAMLSVHNVKDIKFEHCGFYDSKRTDDMIHVVYSEVEFRHSKFVRSLADALDADISQVIIADSQFIDSGNDSIDLMTSDAIVYNTQFSNSADKGISIGEGSQLLAYNNTIIDSEIGMQSKDTSLAYIYDTTFIGNNTAVDAYHKNWRYSEGGQITLENCHLERNIEHATVGKKSTITLNNCDIDDASNISRKDQNKNKITISQEERIEHQLKGEFFKNFDPSTIQGAMNGSH